MAARYQPQGLLRIERGGLASNVRIATLPGVNRAVNIATQRVLSATGVNQCGSTSGLAGGFGSTYGTGTAVDKIVTDVSGAFPAPGRSYYFRAMRNGAGGGSLGRLFDKTNGSTGQFLYWYAGGTSLGYGFFAGGSERYVGIPVAAQSIGEWFEVWVSHAFDGSTHTINAWVNGAQVVTNFTLTASNTDAATTPFTIGNRNSDNIRSWDGMIESAHVWDGILPAAVPMLRANRYQMFADPYESDDVTIAAVVADTSLTGSAAAQASSSGALTTAVRLNGTAAVVAAGAGALSTSIPLQGTTLAQAAASGTLSTSIRLSGAAAAVATGSASLAGAAAALSGSAVAQAYASGSLTTAIALAGAAQAVATSSPPPTLTSAGASFGAALGGAAAAQASGSGALSTGIALTGAAVARSSGSAQFAGLAAALTGSAIVSAAGQASLSTAIRLDGVASTRSSGAAELMTWVRLTGAGNCVAAGQGALTVGVTYARAPAGAGYLPQQHHNEHRPAATSSPRPAATQRNYR